MSRWHDQLANHQIHNVLTELRSCVAGEMKDVAENELVERRRLEKFVSTCEDILERTDPEMLPFHQLDSLFNHLSQQVLPQARAYRDSHNVDNLTNANNQISAVLTLLSELASPRGRSGALKFTKEMEQQLDSFAKTVEEKQRTVEATVHKLTDDIAAQQQKLSQLEKQAETRKQESDAQLSQWQQQFSQAQETRNQDYSSWRREVDTESRKNIDEITKRIDEELGQKQKGYESQIDEYLGQAKENHEAILKLHQLAAEDSVAGGYVSNANKESGADLPLRFSSTES